MNLESIRIFVKVADLSSFTHAAEHLRMRKSAVSQHVLRLEEDTGVRLLHRTTRMVNLTPEGEQFLSQARPLVQGAEELSTLFASERTLRGRVRVDLPINLARTMLIPSLPAFYAKYPDIELQVSATDRIIDVLREGFDCVLRVGELEDSDLASMRIGTLAMVNCASPDYLRTYGTPKKIADLQRHFLIHYSSTLGGDPPVFDYHDGNRIRSLRMNCRITVNNADAFSGACIAGLGIAQLPAACAAPRIASGELVEVLPKFRAASLPVTLLHPHGRRMPKRVRVVFDWLAELFGSHAMKG